MAETADPMSDEDLAMVYAIEQLARPEMLLGAIVLHCLRKHPAVALTVDWPAFLGCASEQIDRVVADRVAFYQAEREEAAERCALISPEPPTC